MATDVSMPRPQRLTDDGRARMNHLLGKRSLTALERGELAALGAQGSQADRDAANARVGRTPTPTPPARSDEQLGAQLGQALERGMAKVLDDSGR